MSVLHKYILRISPKKTFISVKFKISPFQNVLWASLVKAGDSDNVIYGTNKSLETRFFISSFIFKVLK